MQCQRTAAAPPNSSRAVAAHGVLHVPGSHPATPIFRSLEAAAPTPRASPKSPWAAQKWSCRTAHTPPHCACGAGMGRPAAVAQEQGGLAAAALLPPCRHGRPTCKQRQQQQQQQTSQQRQWQQRVQQQLCRLHLPQATPQLTTRATGCRTARRPVHCEWCAAPVPPSAGIACKRPTGRSGGTTCSTTRGPPLQQGSGWGKCSAAGGQAGWEWQPASRCAADRVHVQLTDTISTHAAALTIHAGQQPFCQVVGSRALGRSGPQLARQPVHRLRGEKSEEDRLPSVCSGWLGCHTTRRINGEV